MSIFVDTGAWFASIIPSDPHHQKVVAFLQRNSLPLVTTDYVIDETLTLLRARGETMKSTALGRQLLDLGLGNVVHITPELFSKAWGLFRDNPARKWSFTDCTSKVVMDRLHLKHALALDHHFLEFGAVMSYLHAQSCRRINEWLHDHFRTSDLRIRPRAPIEVPGESMPEPDAGLMTALQAKHFPHPNGAVLVIEVSEECAQMEYERAFDYAAANVPEYWIVNPHSRRMDLFREPILDTTSGTGFCYASHQVLTETDRIAPLCKSSIAVLVADLLMTP